MTESIEDRLWRKRGTSLTWSEARQSFWILALANPRWTTSSATALFGLDRDNNVHGIAALRTWKMTYSLEIDLPFD